MYDEADDLDMCNGLTLTLTTSTLNKLLCLNQHLKIFTPQFQKYEKNTAIMCQNQ